MVTSTDVREAVKTISLYCKQREKPFPCQECELYYICCNLDTNPIPEDWTRYLD